MIGTMQNQIEAAVAARPKRHDNSPCIYHVCGACTSEALPICPYFTDHRCLVAGRVGALGSRHYQGKPPKREEM